jgi:hemerythrin-like domain-containing protein
MHHEFTTDRAKASPMMRDPALVPLSREHHEALVLALRARTTVDEANAAALREHLLQRWEEQFEPHFATEEQTLLPALAAAGAAHQVTQALAQHDELRELVARLANGDVSALAPWGQAMERHVRFEERELFPLAQKLLDLPALAAALMRSDDPSREPAGETPQTGPTRCDSLT